MWERNDFVKESRQDYLFFNKINFEKAYDRLEWDFVLQSRYDMGLNKKFISKIKIAKSFLNTLFLDYQVSLWGLMFLSSKGMTRSNRYFKLNLIDRGDVISIW